MNISKFKETGFVFILVQFGAHFFPLNTIPVISQDFDVVGQSGFFNIMFIYLVV